MDEDDENSSRVVEGVSIRTAPVVSEGYVSYPFVSFVRAGVTGRRDLIPAGCNRLYRTRQPISIHQTMDKEQKETTAPLDIKFQQRFSKNLVSNIIYFILNIIIGLALVPFFLDSLGDAAYALVPLATSVTSYVTLIVQCLNMSVSRYLTLDLQRGDLEKANVTFNTAMIGTLLVVLVLLPIAVAISFATPYIFSTGGESAGSVILLFILVILSSLIRTWTSIFKTTLFAHNRLDLSNWIHSTYLLFQVIIVVILFIVFGPSLPLIGLSYFLSAIIEGILSIFLSHRINPYLKLKPSAFERGLFTKMGSMAGWLIVQQLGTLLQLPVCIIIVNILFGAVAETEFSLAQTFISLILSISGLVTQLFQPKTYSYISQNDYKGVANFCATTIRIVGLIMALPLVLICLFSPQLLTLWVGEEYVKLAPLVCLLTLPAIIWIQDACMGVVNLACNKVRATAIANLFSAIINIGLAFTLPFVFGLESYGVALSWVISLILYGLVFTPLYLAYIIHAPKFTLLKPMGHGILAVILLFIVGELIVTITNSTSLISAIILGAVISIVYYFILVKVILKEEEKSLIISCLPQFIADRIPKWLI